MTSKPFKRQPHKMVKHSQFVGNLPTNCFKQNVLFEVEYHRDRRQVPLLVLSEFKWIN